MAALCTSGGHVIASKSGRRTADFPRNDFRCTASSEPAGLLRFSDILGYSRIFSCRTWTPRNLVRNHVVYRIHQKTSFVLRVIKYNDTINARSPNGKQRKLMAIALLHRCARVSGCSRDRWRDAQMCWNEMLCLNGGIRFHDTIESEYIIYNMLYIYLPFAL